MLLEHPTGKVARKLCPVCGHGYRKSLSDHLDSTVPGSGGVTRCDWNLNFYRVGRIVERLRAAGWVVAGSTGARVVSVLRDSHPHLVRLDASGALSTRVHKIYLDPVNDMKVWWVRPWARALALQPGWPIRKRVQLIREVDGNPDLCALIEATHLVGGPQALAELEGNAFPKRCRRPWITAENRTYDTCLLAAGHTEQSHLGLKTGRWFD